jgi:hypothetical protein
MPTKSSLIPDWFGNFTPSSISLTGKINRLMYEKYDNPSRV